MIGVRMSVVINTVASGQSWCQPGTSVVTRYVNARFSGKNPSQIATACFQRGGAAATPGCGWSNHPSMPVRFSTRATSTSSRPSKSQSARSSDASHASSVPRVCEPVQHVPFVGIARGANPAGTEEARVRVGEVHAGLHPVGDLADAAGVDATGDGDGDGNGALRLWRVRAGLLWSHASSVT